MYCYHSYRRKKYRFFLPEGKTAEELEARTPQEREAFRAKNLE